jgi:Raf kinase inhibitor-like YbhB/YbcL family protein
MRPSLLAILLLALTPGARAGLGAISVTSPDFAFNAFIPARFTCQGKNISPALAIANVPASAKSLVLIVDDPDAPSGTFTHWLAWNIPPGIKKIPAGATPPGALEGTNDFGSAGYSGPCPPSGTHHYYFYICALNTLLRLPAGASRAEVDAAIHGHIIATGTLVGLYAKTPSN